MNRRVASFIAVIFLFAICMVLLVGCGGTGSSSTSNSTPPTTTTPGPGTGSSGGNSGGGTSTGGGNSGGGNTGGSGNAAAPVALAFAGAGPAQLSGTNQFFGISVDSSGKVSTTSGSPYTAGISAAGAMTSLAAGDNLLFVTGHSSSDTSGIKITSFRSDANGHLTELTSASANGTLALALDQSGKYLYASAMADPTNQGSTAPTVYGFTVDQSSGSLAPISGSPWLVNNAGGRGGEMNGIGVSPDGSNVCVGIVEFRRSEAIECYARRSDGTIDPQNNHPVTHSSLPQEFTFTIDGTHVLAVNPDNNTVQSSPLPGSAGSSEVSSGGAPGAIALDPRGHWLAVTSSGNVKIIEVGGQGSLAPTATVMPVDQPFEVAFSHSGNYLFVTAASGTFVFSFNANTGALVPLNSSSPVPGTGNVATL